jgi:hypothetical protein
MYVDVQEELRLSPLLTWIEKELRCKGTGSQDVILRVDAVREGRPDRPREKNEDSRGARLVMHPGLTPQENRRMEE